MPAPSLRVDLRSDTVTRPSAEMRRVIAEAEVGDAVLGDDPTADALERFAAELLGKERALFFPSGIMANQTALQVLAAPASEAIIEAAGHILVWEEAGAAGLGGIQLRGIPTEGGLLTPEQVAEAIRIPSPYLAPTALLCLENTHNAAGGRILPLTLLADLADIARERGVRVHLDGARLPNASVATGVPLADFAAHADTVMVSLSKGLGAPIGSMLAGSAADMERAWRIRRRLGGGMRQAGILAAAGLYALHHNIARLEDDHRRARNLTSRVAEISGLSAPTPETNIVMIELNDSRLDAITLTNALREHGVGVVPVGPRRVRAVTHLDVGDDGIREAAGALRAVSEQLAAV